MIVLGAILLILGLVFGISTFYGHRRGPARDRRRVLDLGIRRPARRRPARLVLAIDAADSGVYPPNAMHEPKAPSKKG